MDIPKTIERRGDRREGSWVSSWRCQHLEETTAPHQRPQGTCGGELTLAVLDGETVLYCRLCGRVDRRTAQGSRRRTGRSVWVLAMQAELGKLRKAIHDTGETLGRRVLEDAAALEGRIQSVEERLVAGEAAAAKVVELEERLGERARDSDEALQELDELRSRVTALEGGEIPNVAPVSRGGAPVGGSS